MIHTSQIDKNTINIYLRHYTDKRYLITIIALIIVDILLVLFDIYLINKYLITQIHASQFGNISIIAIYILISITLFYVTYLVFREKKREKNAPIFIVHTDRKTIEIPSEKKEISLKEIKDISLIKQEKVSLYTGAPPETYTLVFNLQDQDIISYILFYYQDGKRAKDLILSYV